MGIEPGWRAQMAKWAGKSDHLAGGKDGKQVKEWSQKSLISAKMRVVGIGVPGRKLAADHFTAM